MEPFTHGIHKPKYFVLAVLIWVGFISPPLESASVEALPICPPAIGLNRFGVNEVLGWPGLYPPERLERSLSMMSQAGMGWARLNWAWEDLPPEPGPFDYRHLGAAAPIAAEHRLPLLSILRPVPTWPPTAPGQLKAEGGNPSP